MKTVYSPDHLLHAPPKGIIQGRFYDTYEKPARAENIHEEIRKRGFGTIVAPEAFAHEKFLRSHDAGYVQFLKDAHREWLAAGNEGDAFGCVFNVQHPSARAPKYIDGKLGYYLADTIVSITATSWKAIETSACAALTAQKIMAGGAASAFALCRPPGHHASARAAAGYCFLNNAAIAADAFLESGARRVAILDVDYHHGNGTQEIFYGRSDVQFLSIHADPDVDYPYLTGHADETGHGKGEGFNWNYPLPLGTDWAAYAGALDAALSRMHDFGPDAVVISLGVDTYKGDPISKFRLESADYLKMGAAIARLGRPTLFVMEGGYALDAIGTNVANTLEGYLQK